MRENTYLIFIKILHLPVVMLTTANHALQKSLEHGILNIKARHFIKQNDKSHTSKLNTTLVKKFVTKCLWNKTINVLSVV